MMPWKEFKITDYFSLLRGRESNMASLKSGDIPLISARNVDNGLKSFVSNPKRLVDGGVITLNNDGDGGAGLAYYQPVDMALDTHVTALVPKNDMLSGVQLFVSECLSGLHGFFGHGLSISNERAKNIKIMLPVTSDGEPDWDYMSSYSAEKRGGLLMRYRQYLDERLSELEYKDVPGLDEVEWGKFRIGDIFQVLGSVTTKPSDLIFEGDVPRITCSSQSNGLDGFYKNKATEFGGVLTVDSATVGSVRFQLYDFIATDHVEKISSKEGKKFSLPLGLFLQQAITSGSGNKYQYGYKFSQMRINRQIIQLPVTSSGKPDWDYMEQYATNMMLRKYQQYLDYLDSQVVQDTDTD